jgi:hypothetical protein
MSLYRFYRMVRSLSAAASPVPFASIPWTPAVHMLFYVHRVRDLAPGLYILVRNQDDERSLRAHMRSEFVWSRPAGSVDGFYLLAETDTREAAMIVSCRQEIASDGVFACSMLARFEPELHMRGPHFYRCLHWETGVIGQVLYLEAEAAGIRGTGIGCFFDDLIHRLIGFEQTRQADAPATCSFQSLYNFTMGGYVDDPRLRSLRPYEHLRHG